MRQFRWLGSAAIVAVIAAGCEQGQDPTGPAARPDFPFAAVTVPDVSNFTVIVCKEGPANATYNFSVSSSTGQVNFPSGASFGLVDDECKTAAVATAGAQSVTVVENAPPAGTAFSKVDVYRFVTNAGQQSGPPTLLRTETDPEATVSPVGNDFGYVLVYTNVAQPPTGDGCTRTQGYWKTHENDWPQGFDPDAAFFTGTTSWLQVLWTPPKGGNAYYILAHQYIAAVLNAANGAAVPAHVQSAIDDAEDFFTSAPFGVAPKGATRQQLIGLADLLDSYNNGNEGVDHCD